jgi:hypothetical protein
MANLSDVVNLTFVRFGDFGWACFVFSQPAYIIPHCYVYVKFFVGVFGALLAHCVTECALWKCGMLWVFWVFITENVTQGIQAGRGFAESFVCKVIK